MPLPTTVEAIDRQRLAGWYRRNRARSAAIFDLIADDAYYARPIHLRHPIVFYEGHLPAFSFNTLVKRGLSLPSTDARLEALFARGIDPHESPEGESSGPWNWPSREEVRHFAMEADRRVLAAIEGGDIDRPGHPLFDRADAAYVILEHEAMHHETLLYMWHRLPYGEKVRPDGYAVPEVAGASSQEWIEIPAGRATLGRTRHDLPFGWDNEQPLCVADVSAFAIQRYNVTNADYFEFVEADGYGDERWWRPEDWAWIEAEGVLHPLFWEPHGDDWNWRGMFESIPLPHSWPAFVSQAEASAFTKWRGARLPTEAEFQRAAFGSPSGERAHAWGDAEASVRHGAFDFRSWDPHSVGSHPAGRSAWGVDDLVGNGWEWTQTIFGPFPGFSPMPSYPEYSADFFDGQHFVLKGASMVTSRELLRPTFRNWFRSRYPYVYATFRCVRDPSRP